MTVCQAWPAARLSVAGSKVVCHAQAWSDQTLAGGRTTKTY